MHITEPVTMLTDYALGVMTSVWAACLFRINKQDPQFSRLLWAAGFVATAAAAFLGGTFHGFKAHLSPLAATVLWKCTVYSVGLTGWAMLSAIVTATVSERWRRSLLTLAAAKFLVFALWMTAHSEFRFVIYDYGAAMVAILVAGIYAWRVRRTPAARWIVIGMLVGFLAAWIQSSRVSVHQHLNHNDLFHLVQMAGFYLLYRGGWSLVDRQPTSLHFSPR